MLLLASNIARTAASHKRAVYCHRVEAYLSDFQIVWDRMKKFAADHAQLGEPLAQRQAEAKVVTFMREARVNPWPDRDVVEFFARELVSMVETHAA